MTATETPLMQQYRAAKEAHPGMLLLFLMGDFYETFDDDARTAADLLGLTLTTRDKQTLMAGFPHHQLENYLQKLLRAGHRVAVCDQVEEKPKRAEVTRIVTPGGLIDEELAADSAALPDGFKIDEPLTGADLTPRTHEPPAKVCPCLRCGSGLHPRCSTCKMCAPCCWCPKF